MQRLERILAQTAAPKVSEWQVKTIFARSPKPRISLKSTREGPRETFQKTPKKSPRLKGPKAPCRKWYYPLISMP